MPSQNNILRISIVFDPPLVDLVNYFPRIRCSLQHQLDISVPKATFKEGVDPGLYLVEDANEERKLNPIPLGYNHKIIFSLRGYHSPAQIGDCEAMLRPTYINLYTFGSENFTLPLLVIGEGITLGREQSDLLYTLRFSYT